MLSIYQKTQKLKNTEEKHIKNTNENPVFISVTPQKTQNTEVP